MSEKFDQNFAQSELSKLLTSIRQSVNIRFRSADVDQLSHAQDFMMHLEGLRFLLNSIDYRWGRASLINSGEHTRKKSMAHLEAMTEFGDLSGLSKMPLRLIRTSTTSAQLRILEQFPSLEKATISDAYGPIALLLESLLDRGVQDTLFGEDNAKISRVRGIVPDQKVSPIKFYFDNNILKVSRDRNKINEQDVENANNALESIIAQGGKLIESLRNSNCDKKLLENFAALTENISSNGSIVQTGLMNITCISISAQFESEVSSAVNGMIKGFTSAVYLYVAQFPEWERFTENAANVEIREEDVSLILDAADDLSESLYERSEEVDPEVPKSIIFLKSAIQQPGSVPKRAVFALLRSIENLVAKIYQHSIGFIEDTVNSTSKAAASVASKVIIASLLSITIQSAGNLSSITSKIGDMNWMNEATSVLRQHLEQIKLK